MLHISQVSYTDSLPACYPPVRNPTTTNNIKHFSKPATFELLSPPAAKLHAHSDLFSQISSRARNYCGSVRTRPALLLPASTRSSLHKKVKNVRYLATLHLPPPTTTNLYAHSTPPPHILQHVSNFYSSFYRHADNLLSKFSRAKQYKQIEYVTYSALLDLSPLLETNLFAHWPLFSYNMHRVAQFCSSVRIQSAHLLTVCRRAGHHK